MEETPPCHLAGGSWIVVVQAGAVVGLFQESGGNLPVCERSKSVGTGDIGCEVSEGLSG